MSYGVYTMLIFFFRARNTDQNRQCNQGETMFINPYNYNDSLVAEKNGEGVVRKLESILIRSQETSMFSLPHHLFHNLNPLTLAVVEDCHSLKVHQSLRSLCFIIYFVLDFFFARGLFIIMLYVLIYSYTVLHFQRFNCKSCNVLFIESICMYRIRRLPKWTVVAWIYINITNPCFFGHAVLNLYGFPLSSNITYRE